MPAPVLPSMSKPRGEAAGDRHLDDRQFAGGLMQPVGDLDRAELHRDAGRVKRFAAKRDHPRKRGFQASEHGGNPLEFVEANPIHISAEQ